MNGEAGLIALRRSCDLWQSREARSRGDADRPVSTRAPYAGTLTDWTPVCNALRDPNPVSVLRALDTLLVPLEIVPDERNRFTAYYEPELEVRDRPEPPFTEPVPGLPADLDLSDRRNPRQRLPDGSTRPYPARADIDPDTLPVLAYAHPADVFSLQIQGSGRLRFPDGRVIRAAFAAHNGQPFRGVANPLIRSGAITPGEATPEGLRAYVDRNPESVWREGFNLNPRYVFFSGEALGDPNEGPRGAMGIPLTPEGSIAIDTDLHPLGVPMYLSTRLVPPQAPGAGIQDYHALMVAQDTGGAINGPVRADLYFGTGEAAGRLAGRVNAPGRLWVLVPIEVARRLRESETLAALPSAGIGP
jgi:membrane-bound lytic murein transglycosylase A